MIVYYTLIHIEKNWTRGPPNFFLLIDRVFYGESESLNNSQNTGFALRIRLMFSRGKWIFSQTGSGNHVIWNRKWIQREKLPLWVESRPVSCSRFRDMEGRSKISRWPPAAILDFFAPKKNTCRLIFRALSKTFFRLSIGRRKMCVTRPIILHVFPMGTRWKVECA